MAKLEEMGIQEGHKTYTREEMALVRITELERKVETLEVVVEILTRQIKDLNHRPSQDRAIYE